MTDQKLPEEFAPTGPKLSRFAIQPAPPILPRLFPDERRFALRLALLCGCSELAAWAAIGRALVERREVRASLLLAALGVGLLRTLRPLWARLGTRLPRPLMAAALLLAALLPFGLWLGLPDRAAAVPLFAALLALGLPALSDLASTTVADAVTVERRAAAYAALDMGQGLGLALGLALGASSPRGLFLLVPPLALIAGGAALHDLRDRGTPRSSWTLSQRAEAGRPLAEPILLALFTGLLSAAALAVSSGVTLAGKALPLYGATVWLFAPLVGMALASRLEPLWPARAWSLRVCLACAAAALVAAPHAPAGLGGTLALVALGGAASALPAALFRTAAEMDRGPASSLGFTALALGAGLGALLPLLAA